VTPRIRLEEDTGTLSFPSLISTSKGIRRLEKTTALLLLALKDDFLTTDFSTIWLKILLPADRQR
jgi:hypothetical protein